MTIAITLPTAVEAITLPTVELVDMFGGHLAEVDQPFLQELGPAFLGTLLYFGPGDYLFAMPAGQDPQERDDVIRVLILRQIAPEVAR